MIRRDLVQRLSREIGLSPSNPAQKQVLVDLVNDAADELYTQTDLPRTLVEETFAVDTVDPLIRVTLPGRVGDIRGLRDGGGAVNLHDMRPRYHTLPWPGDTLYTFRFLGERPIIRSIDNAIGLYMVPQTGFTGDLEVSIVGKTAVAQEHHASFDSAGAGSAVGVLWEDIFAINKNADTPEDVILKSGNAAGAEMARIFTYSDHALYIELELQERAQGCCDASQVGTDRCIEVLYKPPFRPLKEDTSVFQVAGHDAAIIYTAVKIYKLRGIGDSATADQIQAATAHAKRADDVLYNSIHSKIQAEQLTINFGRARGGMNQLRGLRQRRYSR